MTKHRVVAAIDFGTHGSGYAWATVSRDNDDLADRKVTHFFQWKDQRALYAKNRSALLIGPDGELVAWGYEALKLRDSDPSLRLRADFKMDLQPNIGAGLGGPDGSASPAKDPDDVFNLIVMCLREVFRAACADIVRGLYKESDIRWCVTVPAIWDPYTRELMFKAAVAAGLPDDPDRLFLAQEPAAAALYCLAKGEARLRAPGTHFMVVDAGGGTVDITSYLVDDTGRLSELARPSGTKRGSEYLNNAFLRQELGKALGAERLTSLFRDQRSALTAVLDRFEQEKLSFSPESTDDLRLDLGAQLYQSLVEQWADDRRGPMPQPVLVIGRERVVALFEDVIAYTLDAVDAHLAALRASAGTQGGELALLVGGFAQSPYLCGRLREHLAKAGVELIVPPRPELAVLSGAVHFAYDSGIFLTWRAPLTYGVQASMPFRPGIDPPESRVAGAGGRDLCITRFDIFVKAGQSVSADSDVRKTYVPYREDQEKFSITLLSSEKADIEFAHGKGVVPAGDMVVHLGSSMDLPLDQRKIEITMRFGQSRIIASAHNPHTGEVKSVPITWQPTW